MIRYDFEFFIYWLPNYFFGLFFEDWVKESHYSWAKITWRKKFFRRVQQSENKTSTWKKMVYWFLHSLFAIWTESTVCHFSFWYLNKRITFCVGSTIIIRIWLCYARPPNLMLVIIFINNSKIWTRYDSCYWILCLL